MTDEEIVAVVHAARTTGIFSMVTTDEVGGPLGDAIIRFITGRPTSFLEDEHYGRVQRVMSKAPGPNGTKFDTGRITVTKGVERLEAFADLGGVLKRHAAGDWGDVDPEDWATNDRSVKEGMRVVSAYELKGEKVWVITEWDRSQTTILLPEEY